MTLNNVPSRFLKKETHFAVVMYGGVSLAIYINGATQELYSMVRATAQDENGNFIVEDKSLKPTEMVYRELGQELHTRFVVDILSGTSAGGINAVFLAKALVNGQSIDHLKGFWVSEGDIGLLVNDRESEKDLRGLSVQDPPGSLLNSQRMYYQLLRALQEMKTTGKSLTEGGVSPFVDELDLHITATDINGLVLPIKLANGETNEIRYKNEFHFRYSTTDAAGASIFGNKNNDEIYSNDFQRKHDPFLAYAARCTSSFPFAFEPMCLNDIKDVLSRKEFSSDYGYNLKEWRNFFKDYLAAGETDEQFETRSFGDGGYLDNKPFSYATANLLRRRADLPVDRKLIYIDPAPEHPEEKVQSKSRPNAIDNALAALVGIPRYETIREDLKDIQDRNNVIRRIKNILSSVDPFIAGFTDTVSAEKTPVGKKKLKPWQTSAGWRDLYLDEVIDWYGVGYSAYHQLRVENVLDGLAKAVARAMNWDEDGTHAQDIHDLLHAWRAKFYTTIADVGKKNNSRSENEILFRLDTNWRMRRLHFMQDILDILLWDITENTAPSDASENNRELTLRLENILTLSNTKSEWKFHKVGSEKEQPIQSLLDALLWVKRQFGDTYTSLRSRGRAIRTQNLIGIIKKLDEDTDKSLAGYVPALEKLVEYFKADGDDEAGYPKRLKNLASFFRQKRREEGGGSNIQNEKMLEEVSQKFEDLFNILAAKDINATIKGYIGDTLTDASSRCKSVLGMKDASGKVIKSDKENELSRSAKKALKTIRKCLVYYYDRYEYYDMLTFPLFYGTDFGESDEVEIIRISPEDATSLWNGIKGRNKLAGTKFANFGSFFAKEWRENDILWGRLDSAECLIKALLPEEQSKQFIQRAHEAILEEEFLPKDQTKLIKFLTEKIQLTPDLAAFKNRLKKANKNSFTRWLEKADPIRYRVYLRSKMSSADLVNFFKKDYEVNREFPPESTLKAAARATRVTSRMLTGMSEKYPGILNVSKWITKFASFFFWTVQLALPSNLLGSLFIKSWVWLFYIVASMLVIVGNYWQLPNLEKVGANALISIFIFHMVVNLIRSLMKRGFKLLNKLINILIVILGLGLAFLAYFGLAHLGIVSDEWLRISYLIVKELGVYWLLSMKELFAYINKTF